MKRLTLELLAECFDLAAWCVFDALLRLRDARPYVKYLFLAL
jgi:hypothetical protein